MRQAVPGTGASRGSALGRARVRLPHVLEVVEQHVEAGAVEAELARLHAAIDTVRVGLKGIAGAVSESSALKHVLASPAFGFDEKRGILATLRVSG